MISLASSHLVGVEFFRFADLKPLNVDGYFACLNLLRPLFREAGFCASTCGFYINYIANPDDQGISVRLTYYTTAPGDALEAIRGFARSAPRSSTDRTLCNLLLANHGLRCRLSDHLHHSIDALVRDALHLLLSPLRARGELSPADSGVRSLQQPR